MRNSATIARLSRAGLAGFVLVLSASLAEAAFGPRTTIGKNYQQSSDTQSENGTDPVACNNTSSCHVLFQPIPQQRPLIVQHVACSVQVFAGSLESVFVGTRKGQTFKFRDTPLVPVHTTGNVWAVNSPVMHLIKSGEKPYFRFDNSEATSWNVHCSISGKLK